MSMPNTVPNGQLGSTNVNTTWSITDIPSETATSSVTAADRLVRMRISHGYQTAVDAARAMGISVITYHHHENGNRNIGVRAARIYASHYGVTGGTILYGEQSASAARVQVAGVVAATGKITEHMPFDRTPKPTVQAPAFTDQLLQAFIVEASDLAPAYHPGDVVYTGIPNGIRHNEVHGRECVVRTEDGHQFLRVCHLDRDGTWTLSSYTGITVRGVRLVDATPVAWVRRAPVAANERT